MAAIRAVFLDAGLTLVHPDPPIERVYGEAFARYGLTAGPDTVRRAVGTTWLEVNERGVAGEERWRGEGGETGFWRRFVATVYGRCGGSEMPEALLAELVAHFQDEAHWKVYEEAPAALAALRAKGYALYVVSNWDSSLPALLHRLELAPLFDAVVVSAAVGHSKPSGRIFEEALRLAGVAAHEAVHVGDSLPDDYDGARAAGIHALLLDRRGRAPKDVEAIRSLTELPARLETLG
jgi:putative hydrolase of the HAD superfamily